MHNTGSCTSAKFLSADHSSPQPLEMLLAVCKLSDVHSEEKTQQARQHAAGGKVCTVSEAELEGNPATSWVWRRIPTLPSDFSKSETGLKGK